MLSEQTVQKARPGLDLPPFGRAGRVRSPGRWSLSFRAWLVLLVLAATVPLASYGLFHVSRGYLTQRSILIERTASVARAVGRQTAQELRRQVMGLQTLAAAPALQAGTFSDFGSLAQIFLSEVVPGGKLFVFDAGGRTLFSDAGLSPAMSRRSMPEISARVFETGAPVVSSSLTAQGPGEAAVAIDVPVSRSGHVIYDLSLRLPLSRLQEIVRDQSLPDGWLAAIIDSAGISGSSHPRSGAGCRTACEPGNASIPGVQRFRGHC